MKRTMILQGETYESRTGLSERFGVSIGTIQRWRSDGLLPMPVRIGKMKFYRLTEVERFLTEHMGSRSSVEDRACAARRLAEAQASVGVA
jgi:predicted site-specific integrase-resolvase